MKKNKGLKFGFTTGACAAAASKAALLKLLTKKDIQRVDIPFPDENRNFFDIYDAGVNGERTWASIIKDAGGDPDVTHGAEIKATVEYSDFLSEGDDRIHIHGGYGVGVVTKPGLAVAVGEPAINPVPSKMIREAAWEAILDSQVQLQKAIQITISVPKGKEITKRTLNERLGIMGGISILGTSGIVKPVSSEAWCATITASMDVAKATGCEEIVLSTGRMSERVVRTHLGLPEEAYVMMGDHLQFSLIEAKRHDFKRVNLAAQWAKMVKIAMGFLQTHVRHGMIEGTTLVRYLKAVGLHDTSAIEGAYTAREVFQKLCHGGRDDIIQDVCAKAKEKIEEHLEGIKVVCYLVSYLGGEVFTTSA